MLNGNHLAGKGPASVFQVGPLENSAFPEINNAIKYHFVGDSGLTGTNWLLLDRWYDVGIEHLIKRPQSLSSPFNHHRLDRDSFCTLMKEMGRYNPSAFPQKNEARVGTSVQSFIFVRYINTTAALHSDRVIRIG
jgi:hypothetical protein